RIWLRSLPSFPNAGLGQLDRRRSQVSLWRWSVVCVAGISRNGNRPCAGAGVGMLSLAGDGRTGFPLISVGHFAARNRLSGDFLGAMEGARASLASGAFL